MFFLWIYLQIYYLYSLLYLIENNSLLPLLQPIPIYSFNGSNLAVNPYPAIYSPNFGSAE